MYEEELERARESTLKIVHPTISERDAPNISNFNLVRSL